ncbi:flagellar biosynthesis anti-sigma factor FlgM [Variovorax sp. KK3]|uniref:flagellar biosynthesis anti-sigma factor FlgM n=1 Tax=Variovorax sp. KK3 TaxID=1855728 RepID=UPI0009F877AF|nr:flagellar biosynthesis anti-sigma factor FlgM [Variovorax sp. KK3]
MAIDQINPSGTPLPRTGKGAKAQPAARPEAAEQARDTVQLSSSAQVHSMPGGPNTDFDAARVAEIREAILAGKYEVHPERIADGLIDSVRNLLGKKG